MYSHVLIYNPHGEWYREFLTRRVIGCHTAHITWASNEQEAFEALSHGEIGLVLICGELSYVRSNLPSEQATSNPLQFLEGLIAKNIKTDKFYICPASHTNIQRSIKKRFHTPSGIASLEHIEGTLNRRADILVGQQNL